MPTSERLGRAIPEVRLHHVYLVELVDRVDELDEALAPDALPVSPGDIGRWVRWETSPPLPRIPRDVTSAVDRQRLIAQSQRTEAITDIEGLLLDLLNVQRPPDGDIDEACRQFIGRWGALQLCTHLRPAGHCDASRVLTNPEWGAVPVAATRFYSELFDDLMWLAGSGDFEQLSADSALLRFDANVEDFAPRPTHYQIFIVGALSLLASDARLETTYSWTKQLTPITTSHSPLMGALIQQVVDAIRVPPNTRECRGCGLLVDLRQRHRPPSEGENVWCRTCRRAGVHKRHSEQVKRAERRAAQGRGQGQT